MKVCERCKGLMTSELLYEDGYFLLADKCVNCGNIIDSKILKHRAGDFKKPNRRIGYSRGELRKKDKAITYEA